MQRYSFLYLHLLSEISLYNTNNNAGMVIPQDLFQIETRGEDRFKKVPMKENAAFPGGPQSILSAVLHKCIYFM